MTRIYDNRNPEGRIEETKLEVQDMTDLPPIHPTQKRKCKTCGKDKPVEQFPKMGRNARECADCRKMREAKARAGRIARQNPNTEIRVVNSDTFKPKKVEKDMPELARMVAQAIEAGYKVEVRIHG